jgi:DNA mismatch repair ATPase MutS
MFQDVVEYFSTLFKNDFSSYRDILTGLPDLYVVTMAGVNKKIRPSDFAKMVKSLRTVSEKLSRLTTNSAYDEIKLRPCMLSNILASMSKSFADLNKLVESVDLDSAAKNVFESLFIDTSTYPEIAEKKRDIERLTVKLDDHKKEICRKLGLFSFSYASVSGMDFLVEVSPPTKKVPNDWTR